ncbi:TIGR02677 family protein [Euzebya sp.]|uniref:TIGR02677 family protein n=1 Tax=Euzebya sp. TaxID=1971409 RepID=UPI0035113032
MDAHPTELLPLAAAGLLAEDRDRDVTAHVRACPPCADELRGWTDIATAARTGQTEHARQPMPSHDQPADARHDVAHRTRAADPRPLPDGADDDVADPLATTGRFAPLAHLAADKVERYRAVLEVFAAERDRYLIHLRTDDVARHLAESPSPTLDAELGQLVAWGNLRDLPDTDRVTTVEDFHSRRRLYALTPAGEAAERAVGTYTTALGRRAELQTVALEDIGRGLDALGALVLDQQVGDLDVGRAAAVLRDLTGVFEALSENAAAFMASLTRTIDAAGDQATFLAHKDRLLAYLQRFLTDLVSRSARIAAQLEAVGDLTPLATAVARREAVDAAPGVDPTAAAGMDRTVADHPSTADDVEDPLAAETARRTAAWLRRWEGLGVWFLGADDRPAQSDLLRRRALTAIRELLAAAAALNERRTGRSDRAADYRALAHWFAEAADDDSCHRLWRAAFGLSSARHLTVDGDTLERRREAPTPPSTSWRDAEPVRISPRLRATGHHERRGRMKAVADHRDAQAQLARLVAHERADLRALDALPRHTPLRLSELDLDREAFDVLLGLLSDALAATTPEGGTVRTESLDGSLALTFEPVPDGGWATIRTPGGTLRGPDHVLTLIPQGGV